MRGSFDEFVVGATYVPASTGLYLWHEFTAAQVARDLARIRAAGLGTVRVHLSWDAFMPSDRQVDRYRLRDLESLLGAAKEVSLQVVPVLFAQSFGDCVMLPMYAIDRAHPRRGVRVVCDGNVVPGGPRDLYADPLMLEVASRWLDGMLDAFSGHPAIAAWDLGHDPATTVRPRRVAQLAAWTAEMAARVHAREESCWMTLGAGDVLSARGVRPAAVAPLVDVLGMTCSPQRVAAALGDAAPSAATLTFLAQLFQRLCIPASADPAPPLLVHVAVPSGDEGAPAADGGQAIAWEVPLLDAAAAARLAGELLGRLGEAGAAGAFAASWSDTGPRTLSAPPCDRAPSLARLGLSGADGELKPWGVEWAAGARRELARGAPDPWPPSLDVEAYYADLPDSARDLATQWRRDHEPADAGAPA